MPRYEDKEMPLLDHLEELRTRLIRSLIALVIGMAVALFLAKRILAILLWPTTQLTHPLTIQVLKVQGMFMVTLQIGLFGGIILALPYILYQLWLFVAPGLLEHERKYFPRFIISATALFLLGIVFAYRVVLPFALNFFIGLAPPDIRANIAIDFYIGFTIRLILIFGLIFELPILSYFLSKIGVLSPQIMRRYRRHAVVVIFVIAAILTPPDVFTQVMLGIPLILLYELSIWVSHLVTRSRQSEEEETSAAAETVERGKKS